jgi:uncharacterized membrane protein
MNSRLRNYGLWLSVLAFIPMLLEAFGINILPDNYDEIIKSFLGILVIAGILNNPQTSNRGYLDDKAKNIKPADKVKKDSEKGPEEENDA